VPPAPTVSAWNASDVADVAPSRTPWAAAAPWAPAGPSPWVEADAEDQGGAPAGEPERRRNDTDPDLRIIEAELAREAAVARAEGRPPYPPQPAGEDEAGAQAQADDDQDDDGDDGTDDRRSSGDRTPVDR